jgi:outer membrane protein assembly factor BamB
MSVIWIKRSIVAVCCTLLLACSSSDELEPMELVDIDSDLQLKKSWSRSVGNGSGERYTLLRPVLLGEQICAVDHQGDAACFDRNSGKPQWDEEFDLPVTGAAGGSGDQLLFGTSTGVVVSVDATTGELQWQTTLSSEVLSVPQSNGRVVVAQTLDGRVYGLNVENGEQLWMHDNVLPALTLRGTSTPVVTPSAVYAGFSTGKITAIDVNEGAVIWEQRVAVAKGRSELDRVVDVDASPLLVGDVLYAVSYQGRLVAINRTTGRGIWAQNESSHQGLSAGMGYVYVTSADDKVKAYNTATGQLQWENDQMLRRQLGAPQVFGSYVAVADFEGYVHVLNQSDGSFVARRKVDGDGVRAPMISDGQTLYVYGNSGELEALQVQ